MSESTQAKTESVAQDDFVKVPTRQEVMAQRAAKKQGQRQKPRKPRQPSQPSQANGRPANNKPSAEPVVGTENAETKTKPASTPADQSKSKANGKPRLSEEEWKAKKAEWEARKARRATYEKRRSADNENFRAAMKKAQDACIEELLLPFKHLEDLITEARYTINSRTGSPNTNISFKVSSVRDGSYRGKQFANSKEGIANANDPRLWSPWKLDLEVPSKEADSSSNATNETNETNATNATNETNATETTTAVSNSSAEVGEARDPLSGPYCDVIQIGNYKFSRQKFYSNRFFNEALSDVYIREMNLHAVWNLHIGW
jgi:hypothetical protein